MKRNAQYIDDYLDTCGDCMERLQRPTPAPDDLLMQLEDGDPETDRIREAEMRIVRRIFELLFADGSNPLRVCRNLYSLGYQFFPGLFPNIKAWEIAENLLMESRNDWWKRKNKLLARFYGTTEKEMTAHELKIRAMMTDKRLGTCAARPWEQFKRRKG